MISTSKPQLFMEKLSDQVYTIIRDRIINHELKLGSRLNFTDFQDELKISKTPLREALSRLEIEGFVEIKPRSGSYVAIPNIKDITELYDLRKALEVQSAQLAIEHLPPSELENLQKEIVHAENMIEKGSYNFFFQSDTNFHGTILKYSNNSRIQNVMKPIESHMYWFRVISATTEARMHNSSMRHRQILEALLTKNKSLTRELMELHIEEVKKDMLSDYQGANFSG